jgi:hypothetical protein
MLLRAETGIAQLISASTKPFTLTYAARSGKAIHHLRIEWHAFAALPMLDEFHLLWLLDFWPGRRR